MAKAVSVLVIIFVSYTLGKANNIESLVVKGAYASIKEFGYMAYLGIECESREEITNAYSCGSSILNQIFLLSAAHCLAECKKSSFIYANVGSANKRKGIQKPSSSFVTHKKYTFPEMACDIALIKLKGSLKFGSRVYRVVLMRNPPNEKVAVVSGWGLTNEIKFKQPRFLKYTEQRLWSRSDCQELIEGLPKGTICAGEEKAKNYASFGDSGGPLVVRNSIQVGIVSYKVTEVSSSLVVYTDASYYYDWIQNKAKRLNC